MIEIPPSRFQQFAESSLVRLQKSMQFLGMVPAEPAFACRDTKTTLALFGINAVDTVEVLLLVALCCSIRLRA